MLSLKRKSHGACMVCSANSIGINFGVATCMACKAFFRRNAIRLGSYDFSCANDGDCTISHTRRRLCKCCRLAKCFRVGMRKELILSEEEKQQRREVIEQNRRKRQLNLKSTKQCLIRPTNLLCLASSQPRSLSSIDRTLITNIYGAYEKTCLTGRKIHGEYFPSKSHTSVHSLFNEYNQRHMFLIDYFKLIPEFDRLCMDDKIRLLRNQFGIMLSLNESTNVPDEHTEIVRTLRTVFGTVLGNDLYRCIVLIRSYRNDVILIKLVLIVQSLSNGSNRYASHLDMDRIYSDSRAIFYSQCFYTELLWKYILSRTSSESEAVKVLNKLILDLLVLTEVSSRTEAFVFRLSEEIEKSEPLIRSLLPVT